MLIRLFILGAVAIACALLAPSAASAKIIEVGTTADAMPEPSCPERPCFAISRTTGYQAKVGPSRSVYVIPRDGKIVAWSIKLGKPGTKQTKFFEDTFGGPAQAGITVIRQRPKLFAQVITQSPLQSLTDYFGTTVQFPLGRTLNVRRGDVVALTVPTWAPALAVGLPAATSWRAARSKDLCEDVKTQTAQTRLKATTQYRCLYKTARLTYSATLITRPKPAKQPTRKPTRNNND